jgi:hypothetical protein
VNATAAAITPEFRFDSHRGSADATATISQFTGGGWSSQGALSASVFAPQAERLFFELAGFSGGSYHSDGTRTGEALVNGRVHFSRSQAGGFAGAGVGTTWNDTGWRRMLLGELGAWARYGPGTGQITINPVSVDDTTRYVDSQLSLEGSQQQFDFSALAGFRSGSRLPADLRGPRSWASVSATRWFSPAWGLVAAAGTYPVDPSQGFPGGRFISLAVRLATVRRTAIPAQVPAAKADRSPGNDFKVVKEDGRTVLRFRAPSADSVEVSGDFTQWVPVKLERSADGWWTTSVRAEPGTYQMNLRVDGGPWIVPSGMLTMKDEFGGETGILVIE